MSKQKVNLISSPKKFNEFVVKEKLQTKVMYGSLYQDAGEKLDKAYQQIDHLKNHKPTVLYFDIVYKNLSKDAVEVLSDKILEYAGKNMPSLKAILIGDTSNDHNRPARNAMLELTK